nr:hypothetical protein [Leptolyngbya sp. 7M]
MVNLLPLSATDGSLLDSAEAGRAVVSSGSTPDSTWSPRLDQIMLKWSDTLSELASPMVPAQLAAMQRLVKRIAQLRSTNNQATDTPETLLPYVSSEAQEVLLQFSQTPWNSAAPADAPSDQTAGLQPEKVQLLKKLIPYWLWSIARSTHEAVQLIEGVTADVEQADRLESVTEPAFDQESTIPVDAEPSQSFFCDFNVALKSAGIPDPNIFFGICFR